MTFGDVSYKGHSRFIEELEGEDIEFREMDELGNISVIPSVKEREKKVFNFERGETVSSSGEVFKPDDMVEHEEFGKGLIVQVTDKKGFVKVTFRGQGIKTLATSHLKKVE